METFDVAAVSVEVPPTESPRSLSESSSDTSHEEAQPLLTNEDTTASAPVHFANLTRSEWQLLVSLSCVGFCVNCQPSEPYLAKYLMDHKHLTEHDLDDQVWPYYTYGAFTMLIPIGLATEYLGYRAVIFFGLLCRQATRMLLLFANSLEMMSLMQVTYAAASGADTIYFAYAFLACDERMSALAVAVMYACYHIGNVLGSFIGQALFPYVSMTALFYMSWGMTTAGLICFCLVFPAPKREKPTSLFAVVREKGWGAVAEVRSLYSSRTVQMWSLWWVLGFGALETVGNYDQNLFYALNSDTKFGYAEAVGEFVASCACVLPSVVPSITEVSYVLGIAGCLLASVLLYFTTLLGNVNAAVVVNALGMGVLTLQQTVSEIVISKSPGIAASRRYSFVFVCNAFAGRGLQVALIKTLAAIGSGTHTFYYASCTQLILMACLASYMWYAEWSLGLSK